MHMNLSTLRAVRYCSLRHITLLSSILSQHMHECNSTILHGLIGCSVTLKCEADLSTSI